MKQKIGTITGEDVWLKLFYFVLLNFVFKTQPHICMLMKTFEKTRRDGHWMNKTYLYDDGKMGRGK